MGKQKVQFTLFFYVKQNEEVQLDLQHFEIFIFLSLLSSLLPGKMRGEKLTYRFSQFGLCVLNEMGYNSYSILIPVNRVVTSNCTSHD